MLPWLWPAAWLLLWLRAAALQLRCQQRGSPLRLRPAKAAEATGTSANGFTVQLGPNPETLDPALNSAIDGANTIITTFEPLLLIDENNEVVPGRQICPRSPEDGLTWTFT